MHKLTFPVSRYALSALALAMLVSCGKTEMPTPTAQVSAAAQTPQQAMPSPAGKTVVYQMFTRLFGNSNSANQPWGSIEQNGVGKFNDINDAALAGIKELGVSHVWYTGVLHHALIRDYSAYGISNDDPDVVKGRAGSPYAVKDYYSVNPDLAVDPAKRLEEFQALINRTHQHGLKVIIDIVPNHVARHYQSLDKPAGVEDFGASDDTSVEYKRDNNFYYVVGQPFQVPVAQNGYQPLGGEAHPLADGQFAENPAKWTGNGSRLAQPDFNDWYETVKINYGVKPDGSYDFDRLPANYADKSVAEHFAFWQGKSVPNSWLKFRDIAYYWLEKGVDGFRFDMAEMVPVEFWSFLNSSIKQKNPDAFLLAEVYNPALYRDYLHQGKMDYLYDKVEMYDSLKLIMQGKGSTDRIAQVQQGMADIESHMLHFLENHDEQRIASPEFAGDANKAKPAMVVSTLISSSPTMLYFGQEVGEAGALDSGFGDPSRTSIFDYAGVPAHQAWLNNGKYDGGQLSAEQQQLRQFYRVLLKLSASEAVFKGQYQPLHQLNKSTAGYTDKSYAFVRFDSKDKVVVVSNFDAEASQRYELQLPAELVRQWQLNQGEHQAKDLLGGADSVLKVEQGKTSLKVELPPLGSAVYKF
ncbi:alpha-amylase family glycosyl hydrolase [Rheinheimera sp.]|uniref:alpha-amylase family glycosyl hydrolase n=1 Tax=Rheinheimera sp. TaxID=1869214 RepID=UPI003AF7C6DF